MPISLSDDLVASSDMASDSPTDTLLDTREQITVADELLPDTFALPLPASPRTDSRVATRSPPDALAGAAAAAAAAADADENDGSSTTGPTLTMASAELGAGARIGRYVILEELGAGGMGKVYAAYDPKLDRKVAIKLLLPGRGKRRSSKARSRMAREARALAKLSHPNVVTVYDADEHADSVFIAMELVEGQSLGTLCNADPRPPWRSVLGHYLQAARGLSAAHEVGLIHRDFKPDNVLVGDDGRVRVADFGIAALVEQDPDSLERTSDISINLDIDIEAPAPELLSSIERLAHDNLTKTGAALGTPAYMAPEQHIGGDIGPATDQYALCAALYEGLYGVRPFSSHGSKRILAVLLRKKRELDIEAPVTGSDVPVWVRKVLLRGLAPKADERWPSMSKLVAALEKALGGRRMSTGRAESRERRHGIAIGVAAGVIILGGAGLIGSGWLAGADRDEGTCERAQTEITRIWDTRKSARVQAAFVATGRAHADASHLRVTAILDRYAADWTAMRVEACEATHVHEQQSEQVLALRMHCLDRRKNRMDALVSALTDAQTLSEHGAASDRAGTDGETTGSRENARDSGTDSDSDVLGQAVEAALTLPALAECADVDRLNAAIPLPDDPALRERVRAALDRVDRAAVLRKAGLYNEARDIADSVLADSADIDYPPLKARSLYESAVANMRLDESEAAEKTFRDLLPIAAAAKDDALIARTWGRIIEVVGIHQGRHADALEWLPVATMMIERADDELVGTQVRTSIGHVLRAAGKYQDALDKDRASLAIRERLPPGQAPRHRRESAQHRRDPVVPGQVSRGPRVPRARVGHLA